MKVTGAKVPGDVWHPLGAQEFSPCMLLPQASKGRMIRLAGAGTGSAWQRAAGDAKVRASAE